MPFAVRFLRPNEVCAHLLCVLWTFISLDGFIAYFLFTGGGYCVSKEGDISSVAKSLASICDGMLTDNLLYERSFWSVLSHCMLAGARHTMTLKTICRIMIQSLNSSTSNGLCMSFYRLIKRGGCWVP